MENKSFLWKKISVNSLLGKIIPNLENQKLKGDNGVVGVVGGSFEYTGAPYYSAISALKSGCDLAHVFCHVDAAVPIKSYSPELIVHPGFSGFAEDTKNKELLNKTVRWFKSMDSLVIGPGLGREESTFHNFNYLFKESLKLKNLIQIIDADGLWHFMNSTGLPIEEDSLIIFTPNKTEFGRLYNKFVKNSGEGFEPIAEDDMFPESETILFVENVQINTEVMSNFRREIELAQALGGKIIVIKGKFDFITDGNMAYIVSNAGSLKRCGGIGDILDGIIATLCSMLSKKAKKDKFQITNTELLEAAALGCFICKESARVAYDKRGYSLTAPDVIVEVANLAINYKF